ncbi:hypothetical protein PG989_004665 [Apiospora arundinis]
MTGSTTIYPIVEPNAACLVFKQRGLSRQVGPRVHLPTFLITPTVLRYACNDNAVTQPGAAGQGDTQPIFFVAGRKAIIESDAEGRSCRRKAHWGWYQDRLTWIESDPI